MKIGIVACEALQKEIELLTTGDDDIAHTEFLEFGLHVYPKKMKQVIIDKVNALEGKVDSVFLCYGYCQSLKGITSELRIPTTMLEVDDCVGAVLTTEGYDEERKKCVGTWFAIPFFSDHAVEKMTKEMHLETVKNTKYDLMWFMRKFFEGYSRCLYVDTGTGEREKHEACAKDFAKLLSLGYESRDGTLRLLVEGLASAKRAAAKLG